jgi:hypothetical protein
MEMMSTENLDAQRETVEQTVVVPLAVFILEK